jgi:hypothetical protein
MSVKEELRMSIKESDRLGIMRQIDKKSLTLAQASEQLGVCLRQAKRIRKRYSMEGVLGLISRRIGQPNTKRIASRIRNKVIELIRKKYPDFGPTLAGEKLIERHQIKLSSETLRKWMIEEGIWVSKRKKEKKIHQRRARRSRFGEMLQGDGSPHDWFEGRDDKCCLIHFIDDATSEVTAAQFIPTETEEGYLKCLKEHLEKHGRPMALYVDKHAIFCVNREEIKKGLGITHFGKVLKELDITLICAHSPQAKGRVERKNGVLQDRLIKEMRIEKINTLEKGNEFLPKFLKKHNKQFKVEAASPEDAHRPMRKQDDLQRIFSKKDQRKLSKNLTFQHHGILYLIETKTPNRLQCATIDVLWKENQPIEVEYQGQKLKYKKWEEKVYETPVVMGIKEIGFAKINRKKPSRYHPWM